MACVGFVVKSRDSKDKEKIVSRKFDSRDACAQYADLYRKSNPGMEAWVSEVHKLDSIDRDSLNRKVPGS